MLHCNNGQEIMNTNSKAIKMKATRRTKKLLALLKKRVSHQKKKQDGDGGKKKFELFPELPAVLQQKVASFLSVKETLNLQLTCKAVRRDLDIMTGSSFSPDQSSGEMFNVISSAYLQTTNKPVCIVASFSIQKDVENLHSVSFRCQWADQGVGDRQGQLFVIAQRGSPETNTIKAYPWYDDQRLVLASRFAPHDTEPVVLTFTPKANEVYQVWGTAGDTKSNLLHLQDMSFHALCLGGSVSVCTASYHKLSYKESKKSYEEKRSLRMVDHIFMKKFR